MKPSHLVAVVFFAVVLAAAIGLVLLVRTDPGEPLWIDRFATGNLAGIVGSLWLIIPALGFYFLPTLVAGANHPRVGLVLVVNVVFGWTVVGWFAALLIALLARSRA